MSNKKFGTGKKLESIINKTNTKYRQSGLALIWQNNTESLLTNRGIRLLKSKVDYTGLLLPNGRLFAADAKETASMTSFPLSSLKQHQLNMLTEVKRFGGLAFIILLPYKLSETDGYLVPVDYINEVLVTGKKSLAFKNMEEYKVEINQYLKNYVID